MKKTFAMLLCILLMGLCACEQVASQGETTTMTTTTEQTAQEETISEKPEATTKNSKVTETITKSNPNEMEIYSPVIKEHADNLEKNQHALICYYALYDIDDDGTKELLLGLDAYYDNTKQKSPCFVFTIQNGAVTPQDIPPLWYFEDPPAVLFKNGTIREGVNNDDKLIYSYYRFEGGELKRQAKVIDNTYYVNHFGNKDAYFLFDLESEKKAPITQKEYDSLMKELEGDGQEVALDWKPLAEFKG